MTVLAIGNSFSVDAMRYLHDIARADGNDLDAVGLYYPGCSLDRHFRYMLKGEDSYQLQYNGYLTLFYISMKEALLSRNWDVITIQQASALSARADSYFPYASELVDYVRRHAPKAKIIVHQTWAYEQGSEKLAGVGYEDHRDMFKDIQAAYQQLCDKVKADGIIPSGELFQYLLANGFEKIHRDTFHASKGAGRYALGLLWYHMLTGNSVAENTFRDFDEPVTEQEIRIIKEYVDTVPPLAL